MNDALLYENILVVIINLAYLYILLRKKGSRCAVSKLNGSSIYVNSEPFFIRSSQKRLHNQPSADLTGQLSLSPFVAFSKWFIVSVHNNQVHGIDTVVVFTMILSNRISFYVSRSKMKLGISLALRNSI